MTRSSRLEGARRSGIVTIGAVIALTAVALVGAGPVASESHDISVVDLEFKPGTATVLTGEPVAWVNDGAETHTVTSIEGSELDSGDIGPTEGYGHVFETPGEFAYHCTIHPEVMKGVITVVAAPATPTPSGSPEPTPPSGTLPPNFSPFPSVGPAETPTPEPTVTPSTSPTPTAVPGDTTGDSGGRTTLLIVVVMAVVFGTLLALWLRRRTGGPPPPAA